MVKRLMRTRVLKNLERIEGKQDLNKDGENELNRSASIEKDMKSRIGSSVSPEEERLSCAPFELTAAAAFMTQRDIPTRQYDSSSDITSLS